MRLPAVDTPYDVPSRQGVYLMGLGRKPTDAIEWRALQSLGHAKDSGDVLG